MLMMRLSGIDPTQKFGFSTQHFALVTGRHFMGDFNGSAHPLEAEGIVATARKSRSPICASNPFK
jgi:hypothetical protein